MYLISGLVLFVLALACIYLINKLMGKITCDLKKNLL